MAQQFLAPGQVPQPFVVAPQAGQPQSAIYCHPSVPGQAQRATVVQAAQIEIPAPPQPEPITLTVQPPPIQQAPPRLVNADTALMNYPVQQPQARPVSYMAVAQPQQQQYVLAQPVQQQAAVFAAPKLQGNQVFY